MGTKQNLQTPPTKLYGAHGNREHYYFSVMTSRLQRSELFRPLTNHPSNGQQFIAGFIIRQI